MPTCAICLERWNAKLTTLFLPLAYWLDYGTSFTESSLQWRFPLAFQAFFAICLVLQAIGLPETPRWLMAHDRHDEAKQVIAALKGASIDDEEVEQMALGIQAALLEESKGGPFKLKEMFTGGKVANGRRTAITVAVQLMQQFTGANMMCVLGPSPNVN